MANPNRDHRLTSNFYGSAQGPASHGSEYGSAQNNVPFTYDPNAPPFVASTSSIYGSEQLIGMECFGCEPHFGWIGTPLTLSLRCRQPIPFHRTRAFLVAFGFKSEGRLEPSGVDSQQCQYYWFRVIAPHIGRTTIEGALDAPLSVHLESFSGGLVSFADAGLFRYDPALAITGNAQTEREQSRKRRMSAESTGHAPLKKTSSQHLQQAKSEAQSRRTSSVLDFDHAAETSASPSTSAKPRPQAATSQQEYNTTAGVQHASARPSQINVPSPMTGPGMRTSPQSAVTGYNGGSASYSSRNAESLSGQWNDDNVRDSAGSRSIPLLVRTSTVPNPMPKKGDADPPSAESYQQYAAYEENKAFLEIQGDLDSMAQNWTEDEKKTHRRLVEFEREQDGNHVSTTFRPVSLEERAPNSICVSCIWWEEKQEAYVTSVDTIQLLESLVAVRFTVEEKNRIRRNLEGFHPKTVAKGKPDSEKFFKTIMDFPNPKPRNIEKDVKVFPWHVLKHALKKIVGKYSTTYPASQPRMPNALPQASSLPSYDQYPPSAPPPQTRTNTVPQRAETTSQSQYPPQSYGSVERAGYMSGSYGYPAYSAAAAPAAAAPQPMQYAQPPQYGATAPQSTVTYGMPSYGPVADSGWGRSRWGGPQLHVGREQPVSPQYPQDMRAWQYGGYAESPPEPARQGFQGPSGSSEAYQQPRSASYGGGSSWPPAPDPRYQYGPAPDSHPPR